MEAPEHQVRDFNFFFFFNSCGQNLWGDVNQQLQPSGHSEVAHLLGKEAQFEGGS